MAQPDEVQDTPNNSQTPVQSTPQTNGQVNGVESSAKQPEDTDKPKEMSFAEKKKLAKAEKAARRAKEKNTSSSGAPSSTDNNATTVSNSNQATTGPGSKSGSKPRLETKSGPPQTSGQQANRRGSVQSQKAEKTLPVRRRPSQSAGGDLKHDNKQIGIFSHLFDQPRRHTLEGSAREVHPAILTLGLQLSSYVICGSHARCVAMLLALKSFISSYAAPHGTTLSRHLPSHALSPQLSHLKSHRPFSVAQSNAIRWLKNLIANIDPSMPESSARNETCNAIDTFIRERFTIADQVIAEATAERIQDGDVILTYTKSAVVEQTLTLSAQKGTKFRVIVVDSRPLFEGRTLARSLVASGIDATYCLTSGLAQAVKQANKCILGTHAILGNGRSLSRSGASLVAMMAQKRAIPVIVCAESIKFTERVALESIVGNELAPEEELRFERVLRDEDRIAKESTSKDSFTLLNLMYDVTPVEYISMIITELGSLPPTSAPVVQRISAGS